MEVKQKYKLKEGTTDEVSMKVVMEMDNILPMFKLIIATELARLKAVDGVKLKEEEETLLKEVLEAKKKLDKYIEDSDVIEKVND